MCEDDQCEKQHAQVTTARLQLLNTKSLWVSDTVGSSIAHCAVLLPVFVRLHTAALWWRG